MSSRWQRMQPEFWAKRKRAREAFRQFQALRSGHCIDCNRVTDETVIISGQKAFICEDCQADRIKVLGH